MKKTSLSMRIFALVLVLIMTVQVIPMQAWAAAFGALKAQETGINMSTLNKEDAINWPIKIYDYLSDGMLFEWNDTNNSGSTLTTGHNDGEGNTPPYGGGANPPATVVGSDFTYQKSTNYSSSNYNSPYYYSASGCSYSFAWQDAVDFKSPGYLHITDNTAYSGSGGNHNMLLNYFSSDMSTTGSMRYMVLVYKASKVQNYYFSISVSDDTNGTNVWDRNQYTLPDSSDWRYVIIDTSTFGSYTNIQWVWITFHTTTGYNTSYKGMNSGAYLDLTHVGYFSDKTAAENYGKDCVEFDKNPGEYLHHNSGNFTATTTTVTPSSNLRSRYLFSLNYRWKVSGGSVVMGDANSSIVHYGMDFTTTSKTEGAFTNAYTTNTYWTWANGTTQSYKYTDSNTNQTGTYTVTMDPIGVEQKSESNGAMYVRLTAKSDSKILLSKMREDEAAVWEGYVPPISAVNYMVLVYRANGLDANDNYGLWAQGYQESSTNYDNNTINVWKYAGLVGDSSTWKTSSKVNKLSFTSDAGWQYVVLPMTQTIGANDTMMNYITRVARTGLYLPAMESGESLDLAYVAYFDSESGASTFGADAVTYMNSAPKVTTTTSTKSYGNSRYWTLGNNKGFGMLFPTGWGAWADGGAGGTNTTSTFGYDTWMIGYYTAAYGDKNYNTNRRDPITGEKYTAKYTQNASTSNLVTQQNVSGTTNNVYMVYADGGSSDGSTADGYDTSILDFDGYQLLEKVVSGLTTVGLLEGSLRTVRVDNVDYRVPVYRQETVEYIAYLLYNALRIPQRDASGNYNSTFISGTKSSQFGGVDLNGDGVIGKINLDGDSRTGTNGNECDEASVDLATALRHCLGINLVVGQNKGTGGEMGNYAETLKKDELLLGKFSECRYSIKTCMDAAYYLLNSLFIANSYNQKQNDYYYLNMPMAQVTTNNHSGNAYVFDAGFTTGQTASAGTVFTDNGTNKNAVVYSPVVDANGKAGTGTISLSADTTGKTLFNYSTSGGNQFTTRFPFLPVTNAEGDYAGQTHTYYYWADDYRTYTEDSNSYINRNYNYVLASNGEFVYNEKDALFFEFEGDDDVYLFINGELVLDIGGAHSITSVYIDVNDYVAKAREVMKELHDYGYTNEMTIEKFDEMIESATLEKYVYDSNGKITGTQTVNNPYTAEQKENFKRWARLDLVDGQICQFDFYYMERHGWGANMRIVTNMHITDPSLDVDKTAYQYGQEIEYGGVIDPTASLEYNFSLTNSGNQKLYNLTFEDKILGVTLDPTNGLTVANGMNGIYVLDSNGHQLEAKDLTAVVSGWNAIGQYYEIPVTFPEVNGDGGQTALKNLLKSLDAEGTESGYDDAEITHAGSGLWVDATLTIKGIHYMLTPDQMTQGYVHNTVYLTATTRIDPNTVGSQTLKSDAEHLIYTSGFPVHYQWAGHNIFIKMGHLLEEAKKEAETEGSQLNLYHKFFRSVSSLNDIHYNLCDKYGRTGGVYPNQSKFTDSVGNPGYLINYEEPGVYTFYLLLYKRQGASKYYAADGVDAEDIAEGEYAIIRSQVYVADVEDSLYVLDYGLSTESLDLNGELFKNDHLFGPYGSIRAKLMGVTGTQPSYLDPETTNGTDYCRIAFQAQNLSAANIVSCRDGAFKVNLSIPAGGKDIAYDSATGDYTLTGVGTVTINANVPTDGNWDTPYLYYWYDDGNTGPAWPGTPMKKYAAGRYEIDIPADVTNVIINNGSAALKTDDLKITPGLESTITVAVQNGNSVIASIDTIMEEVTIHVKAPESWEKVYLHHWHDNGDSTTYPGEEVTGAVDANGYMSIKVHGDVTHILINDGGHSQSGDLTIYAGKEAWIEVTDTESGRVDNEDGTQTVYFNSRVKYTLSDGYKVHASVPNNWSDTVYIYYWHEGMSDDEMTWPGLQMTKDDLGWYTLDGLVPADVTQIVINDGNHQTVDLTVTPGLETWITVDNATKEHNGIHKNTASVTYGAESNSTGLTFTPTDFMDEVNNMWLAITVHSTSANPTALNSGINIHNETQMYKLVSVIPASVVYYEDTFNNVEYNKNSNNNFTHHGQGSGKLTQSIDQDQPYGQDATYQGAENDLYSGGSLTEVEILDNSVIATFDFVGTGFEIISRTTAFDAGSFMVRVYKYREYNPNAYDEYLAAAQNYVTENVKYLNVTTGYSTAVAAWQKASNAYAKAELSYATAQGVYIAAEEALVLLNEAIAAGSAEVDALQQTYDALCETYVTSFEAAYADFKAYEAARQKYVNAVSAYKTALQTYTGSNTDFVISIELGSCSYSDTYELSDLILGNAPAEPDAPETFATMTAPVMPEAPFITAVMCYPQFDHGGNGGAESINQVPVIRVKGLDKNDYYGYMVEIVGLPTYTFNDQYEITGVESTKLYIDGVRIYEPLGYYEAFGYQTPYPEKEKDAEVNELRDLIAQGIVGVGVMQGSSLNMSTGTVTWTESQLDNDFDGGTNETYTSVMVGSSADYLIQGPNNEVYMEGNTTNSALIFYVKETDATAHELQIAVRALDYGRFYGAGSTALNAQLQYGVLVNGELIWKSLVQVVSGTEQYYSIPYTECPMDSQGRYQIALRAVNPKTGAATMVSYTNVKTKGLSIEKMDGLGEGTVIYYENGMLVKPKYEMVFINAAFQDQYTVPFDGNTLTLTMEEEWVYVYVRSTLKGEVYDFFAYSDPGQVSSATLWRFDSEYAGSKWSFDVKGNPGDEVTFTIKQPEARRIELSQCVHAYGEGYIAREPNCSITGIMAYECSKCGYVKREQTVTNDEHHYSGGKCAYCGRQEDKYYLVGYINGKNHGCEGDYTNMGDYLFVDGKLKVKFNMDSYVYLKADGNKAWYMPSFYVTDSTGTFYDTNSGNYTEKMYVPGGVELDLTLTVNDDGSLTLHYEEPCKHDWGTGNITWEPGCLTDGERTYTCSKCYQTKTELVPATGHHYDNGRCACGDIEYRTIYFQNTENWENVYLYAWDNSNGQQYSAKWPGDAMEWVEGNVYKATLPSYLWVVFNDGAGVQSANQQIPTSGDMFLPSTGNWVNHSGEVDYYLVGYINGVDYGIGDNINNMGAYKFVDGKLTVTFDKESYVMVKTTGNTAVYMSDVYCDTFSATLYNTTTGASEKMFIPAGVEIDFVLTVNEDDTLSLIAHAWGGVVTKDPACTENGEKTFTCYLCNDAYKVSIPAVGHSFKDDVCTVCGEVDTKIVYFKNTAGWENVYIYAWVEGTPAVEYTAAWPGDQMTLVEGETDLYYYVLSAKAKSVIFNNGEGAQTINLHAPTDENNKYTYGANAWSHVDVEVEVPEVVLKPLYLKPNSDWLADNAWFAAYFFGDGDTWVKMTDDNGDGLYECMIPEGYTKVIFCRMSKDATETGWDNKWNQTVDLTLPTDENNCFTITNSWGAAEGKGDGVWSTFTCTHSYTQAVITAPGCEIVGEKSMTCTKCGHSYTEEIPALGHLYEETGITAPDCTTAGVVSYTCTDCGNTYTEDVAANGHDFVNGECTVCGESEGKTVYFRNNWLWTNIHAYYWNEGGELVAWPGTAMQYYGNDGTHDIYCINVPNDANLIISGIKNDGSNAEDRTPDINGSYDGACYSMAWRNDANDVDVESITVIMCQHNYAETIITAATCTTDGEKSLTCSECGHSYTAQINATGHNYVSGTCTSCGAAEPVVEQKIYLKPNSNWKDANARFAAYFFGNGDKWVDMTDDNGDGIYECVVPSGYTKVIFCRMNPGASANNWDNKWNQTGDLTIPTNGDNQCAINEDQWDCGNNVTWSTYVATRSVKKATKSNDDVQLPEAYIYGDETVVMNLSAIRQQLSSNVVYGQPDTILPGDGMDQQEQSVDIHSASLVLSDDICMNYYVTVPVAAQNVYMTFVLNGEITTVTDYTVDDNGRYVFRFSGINPQKMGDDIRATVYATVGNKQVTDCVEAYSVRAYCVSQLKKSADNAKLVRLISDLLVYGAKAQIYQGYKTDKLVTDGLDLNPSTFTALDDSYNQLMTTGQTHEAVRYSGVTLVLGNKVVMRLTIQTNDPGAFTYTINTCGVDTVYTAEDLVKAGEGTYYLYFDGLKATGFDETVTATIQQDGETISKTVTYSVNSYVVKYQNTGDEALRELVQAIYNYGHSASDYIG